MKIFFCLGGLSKGGAERVVCNLANYFIESGNEVAIILKKVDIIAYNLNSKVKIYELDDDKKRGFISRNLKRLKKQKSIVYDSKPDIILSFLQEPTARMLILKRFNKNIKKIPLIVSVRVDPKVAFQTIKRKISLKLYKYADGYVFQTEEAKSFFDSSIQKRSVVIPNPINTVFFEHRINKKIEKKIIAVGRLEEQKNYTLLIDSFCEFEKNNVGYKLEIYGKGSLKDYLQSHIDERKMNRKIELMGEVDNIKEKMETSQMFVISSNYEGMSNALMEAMALGVPCISTKSSGGGAEYLIKNKINGILVPVNGKKEMVVAMNELANDDILRKDISRNSAESMKRFKQDIINERWLSYICDIANLKK